MKTFWYSAKGGGLCGLRTPDGKRANGERHPPVDKNAIAIFSLPPPERIIKTFFITDQQTVILYTLPDTFHLPPHQSNLLTQILIHISYSARELLHWPTITIIKSLAVLN